MGEFRHETARLILRDWREADIDDFDRLGSDPRVMATLGPRMSRDQTADLIADLRARAARFGHTFWALERRADGRVIGFAGLSRGNVPPIDGALEIGWRLAADCWGQGYATEAARGALDWARRHRPGETVVAITSRGNARSRAVMERLGMTYVPEKDFLHPRVPPGDPLQAHVVYVLAGGHGGG